MSYSNRNIEAIREAFERKQRKEMVNCRDADWLLTRHGDGYASIPMQQAWEAFLSRYGER